jgi:hypothetical protein
VPKLDTWVGTGHLFIVWIEPPLYSKAVPPFGREKMIPIRNRARVITQQAIYTAEFVHFLVLLAAGLALCFGESTNLT